MWGARFNPSDDASPQSLLQPAHRATLRSMTDMPRELTAILYEIDCAERAVRRARLGLTPEDPLEAMKRLGELARELLEISADSHRQEV
jgi:hypothetical protein